MSEPARSFATYEDESPAAPGPLRDWLSAMRHQPTAAPDFARTLQESESGWGPRLVEAAPEPQEDTSDISELMAENLMLKAKLRLEAERQDELQAILAEEIRTLREHIREEIGSIEDLRAEQEDVRAEREEFRSERERFRQEREHMRVERDRAVAERDALRVERHAIAAERDALREERDLWRARTEALAQPLFQAPKR